MATIKRIAAAILGGIRWLLLAVATGTAWLAAEVQNIAERVRP